MNQGAKNYVTYRLTIYGLLGLGLLAEHIGDLNLVPLAVASALGGAYTWWRYNSRESWLALGLTSFAALTVSPWFSQLEWLSLLGAFSLSLSELYGGATIASTPILDGDTGKARELAGKLLQGQTHGAQTLSEPERLVTRSIPRKLGPLIVVIPPDTAAVFENGGKLSRVSGPGRIVTDTYEYVSQTYWLRPIHSEYRFTHVSTKEFVDTTVEVGITYGIEVSLSTRQGRQILTEQEKIAVELFHARPTRWEDEIRAVVEDRVRQAIGSFVLNDLLDGNAQDLVKQKVLRRSSFRPSQIGLRIYDVVILSVTPADEAVFRVKGDHWLMPARLDISERRIKSYEQARAEGWRLALSQMVAAYQDAQDGELPDEIVYRELLRRMFEQAATDPVTSGLIPPELQEMLRDTREGLDDHDSVQQ